MKGVQFKRLTPVGDPVRMAREYAGQGADELVLLDVAATPEARRTMVEVVERVSESLFVPLGVGGGIRGVDDAAALLRAGADKVAVSTAAVDRPELLGELAQAYGSQCVVLSMDVLLQDGAWVVTTHGGRRVTPRPALEWAVEGAGRGAGEILLNAINADGRQAGYALDITRMVSEAVVVPVIASGGAGELEHLFEVLTTGRADAVLAASIFHRKRWTVEAAKRYLAARGIPVRLSAEAARGSAASGPRSSAEGGA